MRRNHPAWRLLLADHAPLVASFLYRVFVLPNVRMMAQARVEGLLLLTSDKIVAKYGAGVRKI